MLKQWIPSRWRDKFRPWKHHAEEIIEEVSFVCRFGERSRKLARLESNLSLDQLFRFTGAEFGISQNQTEILSLTRLLIERNPQVVGEIGTYLSGNSFLFNRALPELSLQIMVDLRVRNKAKLTYYAPSRVAILCLDGFSCSPKTLHRVKVGLGDRKFDFLFIDGDHEYDGVREDLIQYSKWVRKGGLIAFHDIVPDHFVRFGRRGPFYAGEVYLLWRQLKSRFKHWEFIADPDQNGAGIGVIELDAETEQKLQELSSKTKNQP